MSEKDVWMKIGQLEASMSALHSRQDASDALNRETRDTLGEIKVYIAKQKMWVDAAKWFGGAFGGVIITTAINYFKNGGL